MTTKKVFMVPVYNHSTGAFGQMQVEYGSELHILVVRATFQSFITELEGDH